MQDLFVIVHLERFWVASVIEFHSEPLGAECFEIYEADSEPTALSRVSQNKVTTNTV